MQQEYFQIALNLARTSLNQNNFNRRELKESAKNTEKN